MMNEERYHREKTDQYTYELTVTDLEFIVSILYHEDDAKYTLEIDYDDLPELIRFSFEDIEEVEEALTVRKNHRICEDGVIELRVEMTKKGKVLNKWIPLTLTKNKAPGTFSLYRQMIKKLMEIKKRRWRAVRNKMLIKKSWK